jgi:hypothetical protein
VRKDAFVQRLPALGLTLERYTAAVPPDGYWYITRENEIVGRYRNRKAAKEAWDQIVADSGWKPPKIERDPREMMVREATMRENERFQEYWGNSHKFRPRGGVHKNR